MQLAPIVLKIRAASTRFGNRVSGAADLSRILAGTLTNEMAYVIQLADNATPNQYDTTINQRLTDRIGVVVALKNDTSSKDKTGITAYDSIHNVRAEIFRAILGWKMDGAESLLCYRGGRLLQLTRAYLWYQFEFEADIRLTDADGVVQRELPFFNTIYSKLLEYPDEQFFDSEAKPIDLEFEDLIAPDMEHMVDLTVDLDAGAFSKAFSTAFDWYKEE